MQQQNKWVKFGGLVSCFSLQRFGKCETIARRSYPDFVSVPKNRKQCHDAAGDEASARAEHVQMLAPCNFSFFATESCLRVQACSALRNVGGDKLKFM